VPADYYSEAAAPAEAVPGTDGGLTEPAPARRQ